MVKSSQFKNNYFTEMCSGSEAGSYLMLIDSCITQLKAQGPSRPCHESKEEEEEEDYHPQLSSPDGAWASCTNARSVLLLTALEVTQGQIDGFFSQLPPESGGNCVILT